MSVLYLLRVVSRLHVGTGTAVGAVDLPVTRERPLEWPWIPGSSLKGALRARARGRVSEEVLVEVFGPERETTLARGAVEFSGARLLALPLRSVHGTWVLATCPLALARLARECPDTPPIPTPVSPDRVLWGEHNPGFRRPSVGAEPIAVIEGLPFLPERQEGVALWAAWLSDWSADVPGERLAVLHDETFQHAVQFWTECRTRNAMKDGVVVEHQLFTTEHLPAETLLWGVLHASVEGGVPRGALPEDTDSWGLGGQRSVGTGRVAWYRRSA